MVFRQTLTDPGPTGFDCGGYDDTTTTMTTQVPIFYHMACKIYCPDILRILHSLDKHQTQQSPKRHQYGSTTLRLQILYGFHGVSHSTFQKRKNTFWKRAESANDHVGRRIVIERSELTLVKVPQETSALYQTGHSEMPTDQFNKGESRHAVMPRGKV